MRAAQRRRSVAGEGAAATGMEVLQTCRSERSRAKMEAASEITGGFLRNYTGGTLRFVKPIAMSTAETRPKRADARRNYEKVLAAAREAFAEGGESTALEEIARRAGVGIGTLYRHFPNRQALLEAVYVDEVDGICRSAADLDATDPWEALEG